MRDLRVGRGGARMGRLRFPCRLGRSGIVLRKQEGDGATPVGRFRVERVLYRPDRIRRPRTGLPVRPIRRRDGWSDDPADPSYNRPVLRPHPHRCETLWRADGLYDLLLVLDYNRTPAIPGRGSAIFLHVADRLGRPTAGCVAFRLRVLRFMLQHWHPRARVIVR